ncbi:MAG TPA: TolC family protein [Polyangiaceae bacterium]|nr:TolC family protein [Polyangiaceae bacterium]
MSWRGWWLAAGLSAATVLSARPTRAEALDCKTITRKNLVACVLEANAARKAARAGVEAADGRIQATEPWFPTSPSLGFAASRRTAGNQQALNWNASLGVELEVSGSRGARRDAATAEKQAEVLAVTRVERATAAGAWTAYFESLAAAEEVRLLVRLEHASERVRDAARAWAAKGSIAGVEADLAEAAYLRVARRRIERQRDEQTARAGLAGLLGFERTDAVGVSGELTPLADAERAGAQPLAEPPDAALLEARSRAFTAQASARRRSRFPNPTLSAFVARDGFDENVLGLGLALPLPLPEPVGRLHTGEIAENEALARQAKLLATDSRRRQRSAWLAALAGYGSARTALALYTTERVTRAEATLTSLATEVEAARIGVRDAVIVQEPLLDLLLAAVEAKKALCLSSVEVDYAAGVRLEDGGTR